MATDVAVIGGGIAGCALAAFLAERGAGVRLFERDELASAASGRNSGALQHPMEPALAGLYEESLDHYAGLGHGFALPAEPAGVLVLDTDAARTDALVAVLAREHPELAPTALEGAALEAAAPGLAGDLSACRLDTGRPVPPAAATRAFAARAAAAGASLEVGVATRPWLEHGRAAGVELAGGERVGAGAVVVAAGPWTPKLLDPVGAWRPITPLWGVVVELELAAPPRPVVEEAGVEELAGAGGGGAAQAVFSLITAGGRSVLGSTFLTERPDPDALVEALIERGTRFFPAVAEARRGAARACARPLSRDGRPLLGPVAGYDGLFVAAGHGPWGISCGPGSARLVADVVLGRDGVRIPPALAAERFGPP